MERIVDFDDQNEDELENQEVDETEMNTMYRMLDDKLNLKV